MIKLKAKVNKSEIIRRLKIEANKRFKDSWQPELQSESFMKGVEELFKQLRLDDVSNCEAEDKPETVEEYENRTGESKSSGIPLSFFDDKMDGTPSDWGW